MNYFVRRPFDLPVRRITPPEVYARRGQHRREFLRTLGMAGAGWGLASAVLGCAKPTDQEIESAGRVPQLPVAEEGQVYESHRNAQFEYGRPETQKRDAAEYTNFYEFSSGKDNWRYVDKFEVTPWTLDIDGLCAKPLTLDLDDIHQQFTFEERAYRHRCVETWAMCVPWTGFRLSDLLKRVEPKPSARFVELTTFMRPEQASSQQHADYPWPYTEGLTIDEAMNELTFVATGIYGEPLPKQHGAPLRLVVPWKYGFKGIKSVVKITLTDRQPATFWNTLIPSEYDFQANVNPEIPHPRWSQRREWMLGSRDRYDTVIYNGYGDWVAKLYS